MSRMDRTMLAVARSSFRRLGLLVGLPVVLGALGACSTQASVENPENLGQQAGAITQNVPPDLSFSASYPAGLGMSAVAVGAREKLELEPRARVNGLNASPGTVTSATASIEVEPSAAVGLAVAGDDIRVGPKASVVSAKAGNQVNVQPQATVGSVTNHAVVTPLVERSFVVAVPPGPPQVASLVPHGVTALLPGRFKDVNVGSGSTLKLSSGTYVVDTFDLSSGGLLDVDTSGGSVYLYVKEHARWRGGLGAGDPSRFVFGYLGDDTLEISGAFGGTALAPHGTLSILAKQHVRGTFYGERVVVGPDAVVDQLPSPFVIDNFTVSKTSLCTGEAAEVHVVPAVAGAEVAIQLMPGPQQFVQFSGYPGDRLVFATVKTPDGRAEAVTQHVTLGACQTPQPLTFHFTGKIGRPNTVSFLVKGYDLNGKEVAAPAPATYQWTFGDGTIATTASPLVDHDYSPAVHPLDLHTYFTAQVLVTGSGGTTLVKRVIPIFSLYALNRAKGVIRPPSAVAVTAANYTVTVNNVESTPLSLTSARFDLSPCDPALASAPLPPQVLSVVVPPGGSANVVLDAPTFTTDICSIDLHVMGASAAGEVYADHYFRTRENPLLTRDVTESSTVALLNTASTLTADPNRFTEGELQELVARRALASMPPAIGGSGVYGNPDTECAPGDVDPSNALVCQPTTDWKAVPSVILNGRKGDLVMDHGCGSIGQLVGALGQQYSHTSMLIDHGTTIRHSTASENRAAKSAGLHGNVLGFDPDALKYGYPGTEGSKTHTIDEMVKSYTVQDPVDSSSLAMNGELSPNLVTCPGVDVNPVPGLVVGPTPDKLVASAALMQAIASEAGKIDSHYRFFQYSRGDLPALGGGNWATGKQGTVCSSFERLAAISAGATLWPNNADQVLDGMRKYTVDERLAAGQVLYSNTYNSVLAGVYKEANSNSAYYILGLYFGVFPPLTVLEASEIAFTLARNMANQLANCFASDQCAETSPVWKSTGAGIAVSVDDILRWDTPAKGGTYGYNEPFAYVPTYYRHKYVWNRMQGVGAIRAAVYHQDGTPCQDAVADVDGLTLGTSDVQGLTSSMTIATGLHVATAARLQCGQLEDPKPKPLPRVPNVIPQQLPQCDVSMPRDLTSCTSAPNGGCPATACQTGSNASCPKGWIEGAAWLDPPSTICDSSNPQYPICNAYNIIRECKLEVPQCSAPPWVSSRLVNLSSAPLTTVPIRLCDSGPPNNTPLSCPQPCEGDGDCELGSTCDLSQGTSSYSGLCVMKPVVAITETQTGPDVCVRNGTFTKKGAVQALFENLPWRKIPITISSTADSNGNLLIMDFDSGSWGVCGAIPPDASAPPDVKVTFTDVASNSPPWTATVPYTYFCSETLASTYNGGCN